MDLDNPVVKLCLAGTDAEFDGRQADARDLYRQAWKTACNDYEACIAAHYVARLQIDPVEALRWNLEALSRAEAVGDERVAPFLPSLYVNLGHAYELNGQKNEAAHYYQLAADLGLFHQSD